MDTRFLRRLPAYVFVLLALAPVALASDLYPLPSTWSPAALASYSQPLLASGTSLPAVASGAAGDLYMLLPDARLYRHNGSAWATCTVELATADRPGSLSTGTQTIAGDKTLTGSLTVIGGSSADGYTASGTAGLASSDIELPYEFGVSSWTLHIRGGLVVGVDTP